MADHHQCPQFNASEAGRQPQQGTRSASTCAAAAEPTLDVTSNFDPLEAAHETISG